MQAQREDLPGDSKGIIPAIGAFALVVVILLIIALLNAPTMGGAKVMASMQTYLAEVRTTAMPFLFAVGAAALVLGVVAGITIYRVWPNRAKRQETLTGYAFLAPYLLITLTFTVGVILFALYISFNSYDIFTRPKWIGLDNYKRAFQGFVDPGQRDFLQSLYNVF